MFNLLINRDVIKVICYSFDGVGKYEKLTCHFSYNDYFKCDQTHGIMYRVKRFNVVGYWV